MSRKSVVMEQNGPKFNFSYRGKSLVPTDYLSLLSVQGQFGVIWCISSFWQPCIYFWLKYSETFVLLRLNITVILLTSKSPSRVWRSLGFLLFNHVYMDVDPSRILLGVIYILLYVIMYAYSCWLSIMHERCRWKKKKIVWPFYACTMPNDATTSCTGTGETTVGAFTCDLNARVLLAQVGQPSRVQMYPGDIGSKLK